MSAPRQRCPNCGVRTYGAHTFAECIEALREERVAAEEDAAEVHAAALAAARAEGAAEAYAKAVATVERARAGWTDDPTADEALEMARNLVLALAEEERGGRR